MSSKSAWILLIISILIVLSLFGCSSNPASGNSASISATITTAVINSPASPSVAATTTLSPLPEQTVGSPFLPGDVLSGLPVYSGAVGITFLNPGFGPPSFPQISIYGTKSPGYQSASAQYSIQASSQEILDWYTAQLGAEGYRHSGEEGASSGAPSNPLNERSIAFFLPSQPLINVEVHVYTVPDPSQPAVFELLVVYTVPLPKPTAEHLPDDIDSVKITYAPDTTSPVIRNITNAQDVQILVNMVNNLPVRPDYLSLGLPIGVSPQTLFSLVFHSATKSDITITDVTYDGVHFDSYPVLDDPHNIFQETVKQILGITGQ